ncbi:MAG TPA: S8 family serine peptidase, partial [Candidatus Manganitrophaceae bacterium]|nr:S8 family serine peptidase [Candidatus Manganitrophaceae bacterium]
MKKTVWVGLLILLSVLGRYSFLFAKPSDEIPNQYIVVFKEEVDDSDRESDDLKERHGLVKDKVFRHALKGFSATIPPGKLKEVEADPRVAFVSPDRVVHALVQSLPSGIDRINAEVSTSAGRTGIRVDGQPVDVAVIDTGIDLNHPDLAGNIAGGVTFIRKTKSADDDNGHGSHVAGIIAAINNSVGVVGVAPNVRLWAVKVLDRNGSGALSTVIAGIDWVTASRTTAGREPIEVANMSLGAGGSDDHNCGNTNNDAMHRAICRSVAAGVTYVVAAGNEAADASKS